jgi:hypothetical protein
MRPELEGERGRKMPSEDGVYATHVECRNRPVFHDGVHAVVENSALLGTQVRRIDMQGIWFCQWHRATLDFEVH